MLKNRAKKVIAIDAVLDDLRRGEDGGEHTHTHTYIE